ncbi:Cytochrome P450 monooxygenase [Dirofilaria immitis]
MWREWPRLVHQRVRQLLPNPRSRIYWQFCATHYGSVWQRNDRLSSRVFSKRFVGPDKCAGMGFERIR